MATDGNGHDARPAGTTAGARRHGPPPGETEQMMRRYRFALYPTPDQAAVLHEHRAMMADLWNALLERYEHIQRTTRQRQIWFDAAGNRHSGVSYHRLTWETYRYAAGESAVIQPDKNAKPKPFTAFDMQNEITALVNELPEWRALSVWCCHRTAQLLDRSFKAFYARAKAGAGARSGYPRYRRRRDHCGIPHRFASGCTLTKDPRHGTSWRLALKGVPGKIHARGTFPFDIVKWADADVVWRNGKWSISVCVQGNRPRPHGLRSITIRFDLLESFATITSCAAASPYPARRDNSGSPEQPRGLVQARILQQQLDGLQSECDTRFPCGRRHRDAPDYAELRLEISRLAARIARVRANALHVWTTGIVARAADVTVIAPPVREHIATPRGDAKSWGAQVELVSDINRQVLAQAPAIAIKMLEYKAAEAGIRCDVVSDQAPPVAVGRELVAAGKELRRARRAHREEIEIGL
jgi:hypothetical protein